MVSDGAAPIVARAWEADSSSVLGSDPAELAAALGLGWSSGSDTARVVAGQCCRVLRARRACTMVWLVSGGLLVMAGADVCCKRAPLASCPVERRRGCLHECV